MNLAGIKRQEAFLAVCSADGDDHWTAPVFRGIISMGDIPDVPV